MVFTISTASRKVIFPSPTSLYPFLLSDIYDCYHSSSFLLQVLLHTYHTYSIHNLDIPDLLVSPFYIFTIFPKQYTHLSVYYSCTKLLFVLLSSNQKQRVQYVLLFLCIFQIFSFYTSIINLSLNHPGSFPLYRL